MLAGGCLDGMHLARGTIEDKGIHAWVLLNVRK